MTQLEERLGELAQRGLRVVCLPDYFLDHLVPLAPLEEALARFRAIHAQGGGNYPGGPHALVPGGNAANTAHALAYLGVRASLITRTTAYGLAFLRRTLGQAGVDLTRVRDDGKLSSTVSLEFGPEHRNVMLNDPGSLHGYGPGDLEAEDQDLISDSDAVLVANWTLTQPHGTALAEAVLRVARRGRALTYIDTGDPSARRDEIEDFIQRVGASPNLDVWSLNENELRHFGGAGATGTAATRLAERGSATIDLHTSRESATWGPAGHAVAPCFRIEVRRTTGAGDTWNAANLAGHLLKLEPADRLRFANATAAAFLENAAGLPPTLDDVLRFLRRPTDGKRRGAPPDKGSLARQTLQKG